MSTFRECVKGSGLKALQIRSDTWYGLFRYFNIHCLLCLDGSTMLHNDPAFAIALLLPGNIDKSVGPGSFMLLGKAAKIRFPGQQERSADSSKKMQKNQLAGILCLTYWDVSSRWIWKAQDNIQRPMARTDVLSWDEPRLLSHCISTSTRKTLDILGPKQIFQKQISRGSSYCKDL